MYKSKNVINSKVINGFIHIPEILIKKFKIKNGDDIEWILIRVLKKNAR